MRMAFFKGLSFTIGACSVQQYWPELIPLIQGGRLHPERFVSHEMPLPISGWGSLCMPMARLSPPDRNGAKCWD